MNLSKSERKEYKVSTGIFEGRVVAVNPTKAEINKWMGWQDKEDDKEPIYMEQKDGVDKINIDFCIEDVKSNFKKIERFSITKKESISKGGGKLPEGSLQYINARGQATWVAEVTDLPAWFLYASDKDKNPIADIPYRKAYVGEGNLYNFLRSWLSKVNYFAKDCDIFLDKKIFNGNVSELRSHLTATGDESYVSTMVFLATVYSKDADDGTVKHSQNLSNNYMPGYMIQKAIHSCQSNSWDADKATKYFKDSILKNEKCAYQLVPLQEFDETKTIQSSNDTIRHSEIAAEDTDY